MTITYKNQLKMFGLRWHINREKNILKILLLILNFLGILNGKLYLGSLYTNILIDKESIIILVNFMDLTQSDKCSKLIVLSLELEILNRKV